MDRPDLVFDIEFDRHRREVSRPSHNNWGKTNCRSKINQSFLTNFRLFILVNNKNNDFKNQSPWLFFAKKMSKVPYQKHF